MEKILMSFPEVTTVVSRDGRADLATDPMGVYETDTYVMLKPKEQWRSGITKDSLRQAISKKLDHLMPGINFAYAQPIEQRVNEMVSGVRADIAIKLFGEDMQTLITKAAEIERIVRTVPGNTDLQVEKLSGSGQLQIMTDRTKMAQYGVTIDDIRTVTETAIIGTKASEVLEGKRRFALRIKYPDGSHLDPNQLGNMLIEAGPNRVPISQVAKLELGDGLEVINREMGQRRVIIQTNVEGRDMGSFVREAQEKLNRQLKLPPGYFIKWGGQFENQQRAMNKLMLVVPISILIIFALLMATFSSAKHALLVILNVPFALIGGVAALWLRGMYLSVPAAVGFIALFGVAILNGLVLISTINRFRETKNKNEGDNLDLKSAIIQASNTRLRPVLMTALVAMLGFMPMALSTTSGAEVQKPLATVVIGGLVSSTLLTLIVLPVLYHWIEAVKSITRTSSVSDFK
jgi:cobalt-zinc-cadmium resistance protein CzcA